MSKKKEKAPKKDPTVKAVLNTRLVWIYREAGKLAKFRADVMKSGKLTPISQLSSLIRLTRADLDETKIRIAELAAAELANTPDGRDECTPDEWEARVKMDAIAADNGDLMIYMMELGQRLKYNIYVNDEGELKVERISL